MHHTVGSADMKLATTVGDIVVTHALGSCVGVAIYDPVAHVGGILHFVLPHSSVDPGNAAKNVWMFADTAIPKFLEAACEEGAVKARLIVKVAGGAHLLDAKGFFAIGRRNQLAARKILWQDGIMIAAEDVGGMVSRSLFLEIGDGKVWVQSEGKEVPL